MNPVDAALIAIKKGLNFLYHREWRRLGHTSASFTAEDRKAEAARCSESCASAVLGFVAI
jgi:hypothetical protein